MSFDGVVTRAMVDELQKLVTGRVTKIYQTQSTELLFYIRAGRQNHHLLLSAHPQFARVQLTNEQYDRPQEPPMFCMFLRKHLDGSFIESIEQQDMERIITINLKTTDEIGDIRLKTLVIEVMGRHSNIILVDRERNMILDSIKHLPPSLNSYRTVLPGQEYVGPPPQNKLNPLEVDRETFLKKLDFNSGRLDRQLVEQFTGLSPLVAKEIIHRAGLANRETLPEAFFEMQQALNEQSYRPQMVSTDDGKAFFSVVDLTHLKGEKKDFESVSGMLDRYYFGKAERDRVRQQAHDMERLLENERDKNVKKIEKLKKTLVDAEKAKEHQLFGELLTAHMHQLKRGDQVAEVVNYYDENGATVKIPLVPQRTPSENAQNYFRKYNKAKNSVAVVHEQIEKAKEEILYFEGLLQQMESAAPRDIEEIRTELEEEGYVKRRKSNKKKKQSDKPNLESYRSSEGIEILVGKNNKQNEYLTNRLARANETWLHTKDIPGSHVVIRSAEFGETTLHEAANLAAYFSKSKYSSSVPVDFTEIRHVRKPSGAKPGYVIYDHQQTLFVTPDEELVLKLRK